MALRVSCCRGSSDWYGRKYLQNLLSITTKDPKLSRLELQIAVRVTKSLTKGLTERDREDKSTSALRAYLRW